MPSATVYAPSMPVDKQARGPRDYHLYSLDELVSFVNNRSLGDRINPNITPFLACIEVLLRADVEFSFRFLDLPPELRNLVYEYLLTIGKKSTTCHPQVLRTCKRIHKEASNILYAENDIIVHVNQHGVQAHGFQCGDYVPVHYSDPGRSFVRSDDTATPKWPDFIRRAWKIKLRVPSLTWYFDRSHTRRIGPGRRAAAVENVLYSLCSELSSRKRSPLIQTRQALPARCMETDIRGFYYSLRLLGSAKTQAQGTHKLDNVTNQVHLHDDMAHQQAEALREGIFTPQSALLCQMMVLNIKILLKHSPWDWYDYLDHQSDEIMKALLSTVSTGDFPQVFRKVIGSYKNNAVEKSLTEEVVILRNLLAYGVLQGDSKLWLEARQLLLLDIEVRTPGVHREIGFKARKLEGRDDGMMKGPSGIY